MDDVVLQSSYANQENISVSEVGKGSTVISIIDLKPGFGHFYHILEHSGRMKLESNVKSDIFREEEYYWR